MGESPERVFCVGAPGIDNILNMPLLDKQALESKIKWTINHPTALFTYHPETLSNIDTKQQITKVLDTIKASDLNVLFTYANADDGGRIINQAIEDFAANNKQKYYVIKSLGQTPYLSALKYVDLLIGNTSSGIIEAASFQKPVVNIGNRQKGRLQNKNIINCSINNLYDAIEQASSSSFIKNCKTVTNMYGEGKAAEKIIYQLETHKLSCTKRFHNI
jgi:UDP-hydrolysing UDP-N-acetyl-D-glucosamine 2-epimerase